MCKKHILFSLALGALSQQVSAGNLLESWAELENLNVKAAAPNMADDEFMADFQTFKTNTAVRAEDELKRLKESNAPRINFELNYGPLASYYRHGGAPNTEAQTCLMKIQDCLEDRLDNKVKKWIFFTEVQTFLDSIPDDRSSVSSALTQVSTLLDGTDLNVGDRYVFDPATGTADYAPTYKMQKHAIYLQATQAVAPQNKMAVLTPETKRTLENIGVDTDSVVSILNGTSDSVVKFLSDRSDKWKARSGSYIPGDYILPDIEIPVKTSLVTLPQNIPSRQSALLPAASSQIDTGGEPIASPGSEVAATPETADTNGQSGGEPSDTASAASPETSETTSTSSINPS